MLMWGGILSWFKPEQIFEETIESDSTVPCFISNGISTLLAMILPVVLFHQPMLSSLRLVWVVVGWIGNLALVAFFAFSIFFFVSNSLKKDSAGVDRDFFSAFLCHLHLIPNWWLTILIFLYAKLYASSPMNIFYYILVGIMVIRLCDIEARFIKVFFQLSLRKAYAFMVGHFAIYIILFTIFSFLEKKN